MYCSLCEDYVSVFATGSFCETCRQTKNIQRIYGKDEILKILKDICLRDEEKRNNKINKAKVDACYSPACKKYNLRKKDKDEEVEV